MIYPFILLSAKEVSPGRWGVTIKRTLTIKYEDVDIFSSEFRYPIVGSLVEFYNIEAVSEANALEEVAKIVANY